MCLSTLFLRASSREEAEISGAAEVENHPCLSGFLLPDLPFTQTNKNLIIVFPYQFLYIFIFTDNQQVFIFFETIIRWRHCLNAIFCLNSNDIGVIFIADIHLNNCIPNPLDVYKRQTYRYKRALVRKSNSTDEQILSLLEFDNEEVKQMCIRDRSSCRKINHMRGTNSDM